jgi:hypothetical protein
MRSIASPTRSLERAQPRDDALVEQLARLAVQLAHLRPVGPRAGLAEPGERAVEPLGELAVLVEARAHVAEQGHAVSPSGKRATCSPASARVISSR